MTSYRRWCRCAEGRSVARVGLLDRSRQLRAFSTRRTLILAKAVQAGALFAAVLFTCPLSHIMPFISPCRLLLCAARVPKLAGQSWCRAGEAGPSPIEQARLACSSWPLLLPTRVEHEPLGTQERPANEPAVARRLLHYVMVHSARSYIGRNTSFPALKLPSDLARDIAYS